MSSALKTIMVGAALVGAAAALAGCGTAKNALGFQKQGPDEFRVVSKAPLVVPPDYALRPPAPGMPRPDELRPESAARVALLGQRESAQRSTGETLLVNRAGAQKADPLIRYVMDDEFGAIAHKDKSFSDRVMFWKKGAPAPLPDPNVVGATTAAPLDPVAEQAKIKSLTGDQDVIIARAPTGMKLKLPGL